jgi:aminoglycoside phosphotransferase family enzyme/predicted kinase
MIDNEQEIIAFLSDGASFGAPGAAVTRIDTHCSIALLLRDRAYKLKRPIAFSALDYRTVAQRHAACRAELVLNRRTAPELYLGIRAICRRPDGALAFDAAGEVLDWVVVMRRFDQADRLDSIAETGGLGADLVSHLADEIADFHRQAEPQLAMGGAAGLRKAIERNHADHATLEGILARVSIDALRAASLDALAAHERNLDRRREKGRARRCHGDLRLANICLIDGRPTLFDGIEFAEELASIDVLFDLAFLLVDLLERRMDFAASHLLNRYLDATGDDEDLAVLPLMTAIRMGTRGFTLAAGSQRRADVAEARRLRDEAQARVARAVSILGERHPRLVALGGLQSGTKSALASALAAVLGPAGSVRVLSTEPIRRGLLNIRSHERLPHTAYEPQLTEKVHAAMRAKARRLLSGGTTVIVDADFYGTANRDAIKSVASAVSVSFSGLWLEETGSEDSIHDAPEWQKIAPPVLAADPLALARSIADAIV